MGGAMKYFPKQLLSHEIFRSMVSWATVHSLNGKKNIVVIEIQSLILYPMIRLINLCFSIKLERINIKKKQQKKTKQKQKQK